jgi:murein DD-endopeptidase MepM/ murein hydrolase activator NlpD
MVQQVAPGVLVALLASLAFPAFAPAYDWPVAPFDRQHPIRGTFDDPRTRTGRVDHDPTNPMSFHDGVDIQVPDGTPVYAIEGGEVFYVNRWAVSVVSPTSSVAPPLTFGYWHLERVVGEHQLVARHQLLGYVKTDAGHVHLSEQRFGRYVNPLRSGGLAPYADNTAPVIRQIGLRPCNTSRELSTDPVSGCVDLVVNAFDPPSLQLQGQWRGAVLPPFRIAWSGLSSGSWLPAAARPPLAFDEFLRVPLGDVYAPGTMQNLRNRPGSYFFWLARDLDTRILTDGVYTIHVSVSDIRNNETLGTFRFTVADGIAAAVP